MLLAIDVGNTNTVFAAYRDGAQAHSWRSQTIAARSPDEYAALLDHLFSLAGLGWKDFTDIIIASVVPDCDFHLKKFCEKYLVSDPVFIEASMLDIKVDIERPQEAGADRLVNAVAVKAFYKLPAIVIDFGTATTFDVVDQEGNYIGGVIAPGIHLSLEALSRGTAKLPRVDIADPGKVIGRNTVSAIQSGLYYGYAAMIAGITDKIAAEMGGKPFVLATGGLASLFSGAVPQIDAVDDELTLKGLAYIHQNLKSTKS